MSQRAPGRAHREGLSIIELMELFPDEQSATEWFESVLWPDGRCCGHCGSTDTSPVPKQKPMPYWCSDCRSYFSVKTGTAMQRSKIPLRKWVIAIYLCLTGLKSVSSMKLHRDLKVTQKTAWFMLHRIREAWAHDPYHEEQPFDGPVEADETYVGGKARNMHASQRRELTGRGGVDKTAVVGVKDRATRRVAASVVMDTTGRTLRGFVESFATPEATVYTDGEPAYAGISRQHEAVKHSVGEYVRGMAHTNGVESFWSMLKRAHVGTFHKLSPKHLNRYVQEFAAKHNIRDSGTLAQMRDTVGRMIGRNLLYTDLIAYNGLDSGARS
ncbi:MAG: IS1595 family transposase [Gammaproteobacteria bacterium]|nr:IS1595 family transposase [Gammaproteobacteria bacterium]